MARFARGWESGRHVIRIFRAGVVGLMAGVAVLGRGGEVVIRMALDALDGGVRAGKREERVVIEARRAPAAGRMAHGAVCREP